MEIKDLLTPAITVLGVFLTARFALRNEHRKKALEIETTQLESLSVLVLRSLDNVAQYSGTLAVLIDANVKIITEQLSPASRDNAGIPVAELNKWKDQLDKHSAWRLNRSDLQKASHGLRFHREADWARWQQTVTQLQREIYAFFMITTPGEENIERMNGVRTAAEARDFAQTLRTRVRELQSLQETLLTSMKNDFSQLLRPEQTATLCSLTKGLWRRMRRFFACRS
ncbi:ubiquinol-cytochrome-c reductase complex assembly factor 3 [Pantoea ananatis]|uniref:ubiquinol-cytochrome-c reductase complex assembly factor 3 n=1 Tax=Pantoea ananas TaxID=553 RepID=UPI0021F6BDB7|nr:ubiquinol-cytochrome-c reductase complex assembly factor 3 [Pantoea ananatis]MCW0351045.1 hypothetical protein [Pantoea ananatis]